MSQSHIDLQSLIYVLDDADAKTIENNTVNADNAPILLALNENYIINLISSYGSQFNNMSYWKKVVLTYSPNNSGQFKQLTFRLKASHFKCYTMWSTISTIGTWYIKNMYVINKSGTIIKLGEDLFTVNDNITVS